MSSPVPGPLSSLSVEWSTPDSLMDVLRREFAFTLDPCATDENRYTRDDDGLTRSWAGETVFLNPPYGIGLEKWVGKAFGAARDDGATVVCLLPARTDTAWFHDYCMPHEVRFLRGRLRFGEAASNAPFASILVIMRPTAARFFTMEAPE